jgi:hypothetical protein
MTIIRRVPMQWLADRPASAQSVSGSSLAVLPLFFEPDTDCLARDAEDSLQPAQRASFFIGAEDDLFFRFGIAIGLRVFTTAPVAVATPVALLSFWGTPIADNLFASTVATFESAGNHNLHYPLSHSPSPLPITVIHTHAICIARPHCQQVSARIIRV